MLIRVERCSAGRALLLCRLPRAAHADVEHLVDHARQAVDFLADVAQGAARTVIGGEHLAGRYTIEVVDLLKNPRLAKDDQIVAIPTLVRKLPEPLRRMVGDLSDTERTLVGLQLRPRT